MVGLRDPHIVQVLGVCSHGDPIAVVIEYLELGDLHQFLQSSAPDQLTSVVGSSFRTLRFIQDLYIAVAYLEGGAAPPPQSTKIFFRISSYAV